MRKGLEFFLSCITSTTFGIIIVRDVLHETDYLKFIIAVFLFEVVFVTFFMWLFEIARTREERKRKIKQHKERRMRNEKISESTE